MAATTTLSAADAQAGSMISWLFAPFTLIGQMVLGVIYYLGSLKLLALCAVKATIWTPEDCRDIPFGKACRAQIQWMLGLGAPLTFLTCAAVSGLLAMQAYYGATFVQAVGPVVLIGMLRNGAPLLVGFVMAGLLASRITTELVVNGWNRSPARIAAEHITASMVVGPILILMGSITGSLIGMVLAYRYLGVPPTIFFRDGWAMIWVRDIIGMVLKGVLFGGLAGLFACHEGLRLPANPKNAGWISYRACVFASIAILFCSSAWFLLIYKAGPAFGPTVLKPPVS